MLIVAGVIRLDPDKMDAAMAAAATVGEASRAEPGCQDYIFTIDPTETGKVRIFEIWDDEAALMAHFQTPHLIAFLEAQAELGVTSAEVIRYDVSGSQPLM